MKILHIVPSFGLGGMEKIICSIINHTCWQYQHTLLSLDGNEDALQWVRARNVGSVAFHKDDKGHNFLPRLYRKISGLEPDLLMTYNWGGTDAIWIGKLVGIKAIIHHEHGFSLEEAQKTVLKKDICRFIVYRMASSLVTVSSNLKLSIQKKYWLSDQHVQIIQNGIDANYYSPDDGVRRQMRQELGFDEKDFIVVFSGRLDPVKNFELLLEVFARCYRVDRTVKLLLVGGGPEQKTIEQISLRNHSAAGLVMVGQKSEVLPYLRAGDAFLLTSYTEQMPLTILEAMAVGLPVIASNVGDIGQIIDDGQDGFLRDICDGGEGFAAALLRLKDASARQTMSHAARAKIVRRFQETTMVRRYEELIDTLLGRGRT